MRDRRRHRPDRRSVTLGLVATLLVVVPTGALAARAVADVWRAPAILPQRWGLRAVAYVTSNTAGTGGAIWLSLVVAALATVVALVIGWPAARTLAAARGPRRTGLIVLFALPLLVSPFATGTGLTTWFLRLGLADTVTGLVLSHLVYVLPYVVLVLTPAFGQRVTDLEEAARSHGASPWRTVAAVTLPAVAPTVAAAALLGFVVSWSQYGTSLAVGGGTPTLPLVLLPFIGSDPEIAAVLSLVFLVPPVLALIVSVRAGRRSTAGGAT